MNLFEVTTGKKKEPFNILVFGQPGLGKTTFAAGAPKPIILGGEETGEINVARMPQPKTFDELMQQMDHLIKEKGLGFETLVIDTIDSVESFVHRMLLASDPKHTGSMIAAHGGFAKALDMAVTELLKFRDKLKTARDQFGMNIILLAHAKKVQITDPIMGMVYDSYELNLHQKAQAVFVDWVSAVLFANYVVHPQAGTNTDKIFATGEGERVLLTEKRPGHLSKNRFNLPYEMPLSFAAFYKAYNDFFSEGPSTSAIIETILGLLANITDEELKAKVMTQVKASTNNMDKLIKIEQRVREIIK